MTKHKERTDTERLTWLIKEGAYGFLDPFFVEDGKDKQQFVREQIDKAMDEEE